MKKFYSFDNNLNLKLEKKVENNIKKKYQINFFAIAKYSSFGYYLIIPIILGISLGFFFDFLLKTKKIFFIMGFLIGIISTFYNLRKIYKDIKNDRRNN